MLTIIDMLESEKELRKTVEKGYNLLVEGPTKESVDFRRGMESLFRSMAPYLDAFDERLERLQEENERLTKELEKDNRVSLAKYNKLKEEKELLQLTLSVNKDYKSRNEKAIEHLEESINNYLKEDKDLDGTYKVMCYETIKKRYLKPVVDILKGSDKE